MVDVARTSELKGLLTTGWMTQAAVCAERGELDFLEAPEVTALVEPSVCGQGPGSPGSPGSWDIVGFGPTHAWTAGLMWKFAVFSRGVRLFQFWHVPGWTYEQRVDLVAKDG
jgi:hypothetical protein